MAEPRRDHAAVLLDDGTVLVVGGTRTTPELYDPSTGIFTVLGRPNCAHVQGFVATPLPDGSVLVLSAGANPRCAETYDPTTGMFTRTGTPNADHNYGSATLLGDGRVLVAGGRHSFPSPDESHTIAEIYDPATGIFTLTGSLNEHRNAHAAVLLPNGKVLIVGGSQTTTPGYGKGLDVAEIYDPAIGDFSVVGKMAFSCSTHLYWSGVILLTDGTVLVAGCAAASAEIFDPASNTFSRTEDMVTQHSGHTATLLPDGTVMVAGGSLNPAVELYDPVTGRFSSHSSFPEARQQHTATLLPTGEVLIIGGSVFLDKGGSRDLDSALVYVP